jgi:hypothetical protein
LCFLITLLAPMTNRRRDDPPQRFMKQAVAIMGLFFILGLVSAIGRGGAKFAIGIGGLVALVLTVSERDLFITIAQALTGTGNERPEGTAPLDGPLSVPDADSWGAKQMGWNEREGWRL